jgi:hypothetical protein
MIGLPLVPCHEFPTNAPAAFLSVHALADTNLVSELAAFIQSGRPLLLTDGLERRLLGRIDLSATNVHLLVVDARPESLLELPQPMLDGIRAPLLGALHAVFRAPDRVALYLFTQGGWVVENFNDAPVDVVLNGQPLEVGARGWLCHWE